VHRGPQLPRRLLRGLPDDQGLDSGGMLIIKAGELVSDYSGAALINGSGGKGGTGQWQPIQRQRQIQDPRCTRPGQRQRDRDLIFHMLESSPVATRLRFGFTAGRQLGDSRELPGRGAGSDPLPRLQHPRQLIIIQNAQAILPSMIR
jgi:hypothetical protein